jgi:hypothetical protein
MRTLRFGAWALAACVASAALADGPAGRPALTATQVVERNAAARGGLEPWRKVQTMAWTGRVESGGRTGRQAPFLLEQKRPARTRFEVIVDGQKMTRVFDGTSGWKQRTGGTGQPDLQPYTAEELAFARGAPLIEGPLMDQAARGARITVAGVEKLEGREAYLLDLRLPSGNASRVWVDAGTFLERRYDRELVNAQGKPVVVSVSFGDYRAVEGLQLPFSVETGTPGGQGLGRLVIEKVALNPRLADRTFAKPGSAVARGRGMTIDTRSVTQGTPPRAAP